MIILSLECHLNVLEQLQTIVILFVVMSHGLLDSLLLDSLFLNSLLDSGVVFFVFFY